jgi:hypothetical protein
MKQQYQIFDGLHYISVIRTGGKYLRLRNMDNKRYAITYDMATAERINAMLNDKGISSEVIPYVKDWKRNNQSFIYKTEINEII